MSGRAQLPLAAVLIVAVLFVAVPTTASTATAALPRVLTCAGKTVLKPSSYVLSCADANSYFDKLHWRNWGPTSAAASGIYVRNTCTPTCGKGHFIQYPATLMLSKPKNSKYGPLFSVVRYRYAVSASAALPVKPRSTIHAPCSVAPIVAALQAEYGVKVRVVYNGHLICAGPLAEIFVMIDNLQSLAPGYTGPVGAPHGALMQYVNGAWRQVDLTKPNPYCTADGRQTVAVPTALGHVCGIQ